jgi:hypothetical protein
MVDAAKRSYTKPVPRLVYRGIDVDTLACEPDRGCEASPSCLECPLPVCLEDLPWRERAETKRLAIQARLDRASMS